MKFLRRYPPTYDFLSLEDFKETKNALYLKEEAERDATDAKKGKDVNGKTAAEGGGAAAAKAEPLLGRAKAEAAEASDD